MLEIKFMQRAIRLFLFLFFLIAFLSLLKVLLLNLYPDFSQYYWGLKTISQGLNPYISSQNALTPTTYPPFVLFLLSPFGFLPFVWAEKLWTFMSLILLFSSVFLIFKIYKQKLFSNLGFLILGLVSLSFPVKFTLGMGQINNLILFLFVLSVYLLQKKKNYLSSFSLSLSLAIKFFPVFFPLYFILKRRWKILFFTVITFCGFYLIAYLLDPKINFYFYKYILPTFLSGWKTDYYNQSLAGFIGRSFAAGVFRDFLKNFLPLIFILISFFVIIKSLKNEQMQNMHLGLLISLNLIVNSFSWQHHFVFMIFPFLVTFFFVKKIKNNFWFLLTIFISYLLISFNLVNPNAVPILLRSHVFYGAVLMWALQVFLIWRDSPKLQLRFPSA